MDIEIILPIATNTRFYENESTTDYPYGHTMIDVNYDYMQAFNDKNIINYNNKIPIMHNTKLANTWLSQTIATPILKTCDYFDTNKKASNYNEYYSTSADKAKLIMSNMEPFIINNKYINIQHLYPIGEIWDFYY